ncbi:MAG: acyltransferase [Candidatus Sedimenticola sp. 6PFRAG7]
MTQNALEMIPQQVLGESSNRIILQSVEENRLATDHMVNQAKRHLDIFTYDFDAPIYNQQAFIDRVKQLATRSRESRVRILLQDNEKVQKQGHRFIELARRLPSVISIRRPHKDYRDLTENFLIVDETGFIHRDLYTQYDAEVEFNDRLVASKLSGFFNEIWEYSEPDIELRRLSL